MDSEERGTSLLVYAWPLMGLCVIAAILLLGTHGLGAGVVMLALSAFGACYGIAVATDWHGGTGEIVRRLSARESPLRLVSLWLMRLVGIGILGMAAILIAGAIQVID
jgi:hypothetical protein